MLVPAEGVPLPPRRKLGESEGLLEALCAPLKAELLLPVGVRVGSSGVPLGAEDCEGGGVAVSVGAPVAVGGGLTLPQLLPLPVPLCVGEAVPQPLPAWLAEAALEKRDRGETVPPAIPVGLPLLLAQGKGVGDPAPPALGDCVSAAEEAAESVAAWLPRGELVPSRGEGEGEAVGKSGVSEGAAEGDTVPPPSPGLPEARLDPLQLPHAPDADAGAVAPEVLLPLPLAESLRAPDAVREGLAEGESVCTERVGAGVAEAASEAAPLAVAGAVRAPAPLPAALAVAPRDAAAPFVAAGVAVAVPEASPDAEGHCEGVAVPRGLPLLEPLPLPLPQPEDSSLAEGVGVPVPVPPCAVALSVAAPLAEATAVAVLKTVAPPVALPQAETVAVALTVELAQVVSLAPALPLPEELPPVEAEAPPDALAVAVAPPESVPMAEAEGAPLPWLVAEAAPLAVGGAEGGAPAVELPLAEPVPATAEREGLAQAVPDPLLHAEGGGVEPPLAEALPQAVPGPSDSVRDSVGAGVPAALKLPPPVALLARLRAGREGSGEPVPPPPVPLRGALALPPADWLSVGVAGGEGAWEGEGGAEGCAILLEAGVPLPPSDAVRSSVAMAQAEAMGVVEPPRIEALLRAEGREDAEAHPHALPLAPLLKLACATAVPALLHDAVAQSDAPGVAEGVPPPLPVASPPSLAVAAAGLAVPSQLPSPLLLALAEDAGVRRELLEAPSEPVLPPREPEAASLAAPLPVPAALPLQLPLSLGGTRVPVPATAEEDTVAEADGVKPSMLLLPAAEAVPLRAPLALPLARGVALPDKLPSHPEAEPQALSEAEASKEAVAAAVSVPPPVPVAGAEAAAGALKVPEAVTAAEPLRDAAADALSDTVTLSVSVARGDIVPRGVSVPAPVAVRGALSEALPVAPPDAVPPPLAVAAFTVADTEALPLRVAPPDCNAVLDCWALPLPDRVPRKEGVACTLPELQALPAPEALEQALLLPPVIEPRCVTDTLREAAALPLAGLVKEGEGEGLCGADWAADAEAEAVAKTVAQAVGEGVAVKRPGVPLPLAEDEPLAAPLAD